MALQPTSRQVLSFKIWRSADFHNYRGSTILSVDSVNTKRAISRRAAVLLESELVGISGGVDVSLFEFVESLEAVVRGDHTASERVREMAVALTPQLSVRRGRKVSAASGAHELLLSLTSESYTWDDLIRDFSDPQTGATRLAFGDPHFDPRPAHRRRKERLRLKSR